MPKKICVVVMDTSEPFLHVDMKDTVNMVLEGEIAEHSTNLEPTICRKYIWSNMRGKPMLYIQLKKALYGILHTVLLFWKLLSVMLICWDLIINPYDFL